ncbi:MAG TPA: hypothetical protein DHU55_07630 [Blastocatellia bacterium]|nr:hypothetical protein [Blastocatellia bacterium]HAF25101.1 hypothetical protein [Blastocatellia bacterium]HCX29630.1 hypothetical protein [Blastocatellia bacterium]
MQDAREDIRPAGVVADRQGERHRVGNAGEFGARAQRLGPEIFLLILFISCFFGVIHPHARYAFRD